MGSISREKISEPNSSRCLATVLAIGSANPPNCINQIDYPDYYFKITKSEHLTDLKNKFRRMCDKSTVQKRYMILTEEILKENPNLCTYDAPSLDSRQEILIAEVPKLGKQAALKAIQEWGKPISDITHLIFCSVSGVDMPGADFRLTKLLGLNPSVKRIMLYSQGCSAGAMVLRLAKDFSENNAGARVLVVCSEITVGTFRGPSDQNLSCLVNRAIVGDGAVALIVGSKPDLSEKSLFEIVSSTQDIIPETEDAIAGKLREIGLTVHLSNNLSASASDQIENCLTAAIKAAGIGINDWNELFWVVHPLGPKVIDEMEVKLKLEKGKMEKTRNVLSEYGNMASATVLFILDEMRKKSVEEGKSTTGEGLEWGVLVGIGAGLTVETVVLHSFPVN